MTMIEQIEMLKAMMRKKDEAIVALYGALIDNFCHEDSCPFLKDDPNRCETCSCMPARMSAVEALSLTPALAKLESDAARVTELEGVIVKKDEALWLARQALHCLDSCFEKSGDKCVYGGQEKPCKAVKAKDAVIEALSLTPASVAQQVEDARVGKAVEDWLGEASKSAWSDDEGYALAVKELKKVIAKAREGNNRG